MNNFDLPFLEYNRQVELSFEVLPTFFLIGQKSIYIHSKDV